MGSFIHLVAIHLAIIQAVYPQCVNRVVQGPNGPIELLPNQVLVPQSGVPVLGPIPPQGRPVYIPGPSPQPCKNAPQPIIFPTPGQALPAEYANIANLGPAIANMLPTLTSAPPNLVSGNLVAPNAPSGILPTAESYSPTVIHDSSVANSLANALQLLVVSNLLSNTLPGPYEPPYYDGYYPGYNYIY